MTKYNTHVNCSFGVSGPDVYFLMNDFNDWLKSKEINGSKINYSRFDFSKQEVIPKSPAPAEKVRDK